MTFFFLFFQHNNKLKAFLITGFSTSKNNFLRAGSKGFDGVPVSHLITLPFNKEKKNSSRKKYRERKADARKMLLQESQRIWFACSFASSKSIVSPVNYVNHDLEKQKETIINVIG